MVYAHVFSFDYFCSRWHHARNFMIPSVTWIIWLDSSCSQWLHACNSIVSGTARVISIDSFCTEWHHARNSVASDIARVISLDSFCSHVSIMSVISLDFYSSQRHCARYFTWFLFYFEASRLWCCLCSLWNSACNKDQFRYTKIQPNTVDLWHQHEALGNKPQTL